MTDDKAHAILETYVKPTADRGGICWYEGGLRGSGIDTKDPVQVSGSRITLTALYSMGAGIGTQGSFSGKDFAVVQKYTINRGRVTVDAKDLREIRVFETDANERVRVWCPSVKPGFFVVFRPKKPLPNLAGLAFNARGTADIDTILAALTYLSSDAKLISGQF